jgi:hypothetical protein
MTNRPLLPRLFRAIWGTKPEPVLPPAIVLAYTPLEEPTMSDATTTATPVTPDTDAVLAKVKAVLTTAGHDVELVWDEIVALAKKLA